MFNSLKDFIKLVFDIGLYREIFQSLNKNKLRSLLSGFTVALKVDDNGESPPYSLKGFQLEYQLGARR